MSPDLYPRIKQATVDRIEATDLTGLEITGGVHSQIYPDVKRITLPPAVSVWTMKQLAGQVDVNSSESEAAWFTVLVSIMDNAMQADPHAKATIYTTALATFMAAFKLPASGKFELEDCPEVKRCVVVPDVTFDQRTPDYQSIQSSFALRFWAVESR